MKSCDGGFNPRARGGRDGNVVITGGMTEEFQSTRPRRARLFAGALLVVRSNVSIHAPAEGAT